LRFLADQNVEAPIVARLRRAGHDVLQLTETLPVRALDDQVLHHAREGSRILLTNDKDFGELTFLQRKAAAGVVLLRMPFSDSGRKAERLLEALEVVGSRLSGSMVVVTERAIRRRPLPVPRP
jgi:predicted nuclease of predicted toxin-antitoxin system